MTKRIFVVLALVGGLMLGIWTDRALNAEPIHATPYCIGDN